MTVTNCGYRLRLHLRLPVTVSCDGYRLRLLVVGVGAVLAVIGSGFVWRLPVTVAVTCCSCVWLLVLVVVGLVVLGVFRSGVVMSGSNNLIRREKELRG